jgi:hypothetical protein
VTTMNVEPWDGGNWHESAGEIEALIGAAGGYVLPSDDLRPRVLETARTERRERHARRTIRRLAACVVLAAIGAGAVGQHLRTSAAQSRLNELGADSQTMHDRAARRAAGAGGFSWGLVDAFSELREDQSEAISPGR